MRVLTVIFSLLISAAVAAEPEAYYQAAWCNERGVTEYRLDDGARVDCLTKTHAVEVDFARKWAEAIGQALYYAAATDKKPGILLIVGKDDTRYLMRLFAAIQRSGTTIDVYMVSYE